MTFEWCVQHAQEKFSSRRRGNPKSGRRTAARRNGSAPGRSRELPAGCGRAISLRPKRATISPNARRARRPLCVRRLRVRQRPTDYLGKFPRIGSAIDHESGQGLPASSDTYLPAAAAAGMSSRAIEEPFQSLRDGSASQSPGYPTPPTASCFHEVAHRLDEKLVAFVKLDEVPFLVHLL